MVQQVSEHWQAEKPLQALIDQLHAEGCSCVIGNGNDIRSFRQRGVDDLLQLYDSESGFLKGAAIADKIIGRAAASLMIAGQVKWVYTDTLSRFALTFFEQSDVEVYYRHLTEHVINRTGTDWCPLEKRCQECQTPMEAITQIKEFKSKNTPRKEHIK